MESGFRKAAPAVSTVRHAVKGAKKIHHAKASRRRVSDDNVALVRKRNRRRSRKTAADRTSNAAGETDVAGGILNEADFEDEHERRIEAPASHSSSSPPLQVAGEDSRGSHSASAAGEPILAVPLKLKPAFPMVEKPELIKKQPTRSTARERPQASAQDKAAQRASTLLRGRAHMDAKAQLAESAKNAAAEDTAREAIAERYWEDVFAAKDAAKAARKAELRAYREERDRRERTKLDDVVTQQEYPALTTENYPELFECDLLDKHFGCRG